MADVATKVGGTIFLKVDGRLLRVRGKWTLNDGSPMREGVVGSDGPHGFKETPQIPYIEGEITVGDTDVRALKRAQGVTVTCEYGQNRVGALRSAWFAGEGSQDLEEGTMQVRFEGLSYEQVR